MGINVFEGARRIAKLVTLLWVVGCVIYTIDDVLDLRKQNLEAQLKQSSITNADESLPDLTPEEVAKIKGEPRIGQQIAQADAKPDDQLIKEYNDWKAKKEQPSPELMNEYKVWKAKKKEPRIGQQIAQQPKNKRTPIDETPYIDPVKYEEAARKLGFIKPEKTAGQKTWEHIGTGLLCLFGGVAFIWALTWAIGWIVRGFFGIPTGQDFKP